MAASQICIVCEQEIKEEQVAPGINPGDWVICTGCDAITTDRQQARRHWEKHYGEWVRLKKIEEAARVAFAHLSYLDDSGVLTRKEEPMMKVLTEALRR